MREPPRNPGRFRVGFDTDYVETRRVHTAFPFVVIDGVRYSVVKVPADIDSQMTSAHAVLLSGHPG